MEMVPFLVRPFFRVLAAPLALVIAFGGSVFARIAYETGTSNLWLAAAFTAVAGFVFLIAFFAGTIAAFGALPRFIVGPDDDDGEPPTGAV